MSSTISGADFEETSWENDEFKGSSRKKEVSTSSESKIGVHWDPHWDHSDWDIASKKVI